MRWLSSHASLYLPWSISAPSHTRVCPIIPLLMNSHPSPAALHPPPHPPSFPCGVREGYVNGQRAGLSKRWEECERVERCCAGHYWDITFSGKAGRMGRVCVSEWAGIFLCVHVGWHDCVFSPITTNITNTLCMWILFSHAVISFFLNPASLSVKIATISNVCLYKQTTYCR